MKRRRIIVLLFILAIILFFVPFLFEKGTNENISTGINLISGFSSLLTLLIALFLFNKFGIDTSILEKQTKEVFNLLENLNNSNILLRGPREFIRFTPTKPYMKFYESFYDKRLLFSTKYIDGLQHIWKFSDNVFLPKEIAEKLRDLRIYAIARRNEEMGDDFLQVSAPFKTEETDFFGIANNAETTFVDFIRKWIDLLDEIKKWIANNSSVKSELNLE